HEARERDRAAGRGDLFADQRLQARTVRQRVGVRGRGRHGSSCFGRATGYGTIGTSVCGLCVVGVSWKRAWPLPRGLARTPALSCIAMNASPRPVALVTGAARRLGAAIARGLHAAGHDLALHYRSSAADMQALVDELEARRSGSTLVLQADLAQFDRLPELVAQTVGRFGRLDALVNNASGFTPTPLGAVTPAQWDALFASNARAPFFLAQAAAPHLAAARGAIVNLLDIHAQRPLRDHAVYCMAKA